MHVTHTHRSNNTRRNTHIQHKEHNAGRAAPPARANTPPRARTPHRAREHPRARSKYVRCPDVFSSFLRPLHFFEPSGNASHAQGLCASRQAHSGLSHAVFKTENGARVAEIS
jgi:hypothetical protein